MTANWLDFAKSGEVPRLLGPVTWIQSAKVELEAMAQVAVEETVAAAVTSAEESEGRAFPQFDEDDWVMSDSTLRNGRTSSIERRLDNNAVLMEGTNG